MKFLRLEEVLVIHQQMLRIGGGKDGLLSFSMLHSAIERPRSKFAGRYLYKTIWLKVGALLQSLVKNHAFNDGNKRTAYYSTKRLLFKNGYVLNPKRENVLDFMVRVDVDNLSVKKIATWLKENSVKSGVK